MKVFIAGHKGMVGSSLVRIFSQEIKNKILTVNRNKVDLENYDQTFNYIKKNKPDAIIIAAAKVGGILANSNNKIDFLNINIAIALNLINSAYRNNIKKLIFLGSSCVYPGNSKQPIKETELLKSPLEKTNEAYALAKIVGIKLCQYYNETSDFNYISLMPCNLYGPKDNYDLFTAHVLPALIRKFHEAKIKESKVVEIWGSGNVLREFMYVDDLSYACLKIFKKDINLDLINIGYGTDLTILQLAKKIQKIIDVKCKLKFNAEMPDGVKRKILDSSLIRAQGWKPTVSLDIGIKKTYKEYLKSI